MRTLTLLFCISLFMLGGVHSIQAQNVLSQEQQEKVVENVSKYINELNLSEKDKPAFRMIIEDFFIGLAALRATNFSANTNKKIILALIKGRDSRVKDLLSAEQFKVYKASIKELQANIREFMSQQK